VRQIPRQPEQLQLKRKSERIERGARRSRLELVDKVEESCQGLERSRVPFLLCEQAQHRLGPDEPNPEPVLLLSDGVMRVQQLDSRDGLKLSRPLVQQHLDMGERLEARAEPRLRLADSLCDSADTTSVERVEVKDPIRFPQSEGAKDNRLSSVRASPGHGVSV
jgi:hypothetical protein